MGIYELWLTMSEWLSTGIYDVIVEFVSYWIQMTAYASLKATATLMLFSWDIAKDIMEDLQITAYLNQMYDHVDSQIFDIMLFFRLPETFSVLINAYVTRYVFRFMGGVAV